MDGLAIALQAMPSSAMSMLEAKRQALAGAAWVGSAAAVRFLLKAGAEPDAVTPMSTSPAMVFAAECGHLDAMRALKEQGADVFAGSKPESSDNILYGAFEAAIGGKQFLVASWLLDNGYNVCENGESERISRLVTHLDTTSGVPAELKDRLVCPTH
jgi:ankyrin repeat protein